MTTVLAIIAVVISTTALGVTWWNARSDSRSAVAAEAAAISSDRAADAAKDAAESAARMARAEDERDHEMCRPRDPDAKFEYGPSGRGDDYKNLFFTFTPPRGYRIAGRTSFGPDKGRGSLSIVPSPVIEAGQPVRMFVDELSQEKSEPLVKMLELEFWPAIDGDPGEAWTCRCHRNIDPQGGPHWVWNVPVELPPMRPVRIGGRLIG